jgi:undecaprenyl-diphosphatase
MRSPTSDLTVGQALALGALHGPAELLPVSSSAHTSVIPWLLGWRYGDLDPELQKSFEVALHAGTALGVIGRLRALDRRGALITALASLPPAVAGLAFERKIERRLGTPGTIAAALLAGAVALAIADRCPQDRSRQDARPSDALWLGVAQACALVPGISRAGATLSAARFLRFRPDDARLLSEQAALPVLAGASLLKAVRLRRRGLGRHDASALAVGAGASLVSTLALAAVSRRGAALRRLSPYAAYRVALASAILIRLRLGSNAHDQGHTWSV